MKFMNQFKEGTSLVLLVVLLVALAMLIIFAPFAVIWAINCLFPLLAIPYTFWTWLAVIVLRGVLSVKVNISK